MIELPSIAPSASDRADVVAGSMYRHDVTLKLMITIAIERAYREGISSALCQVSAEIDRIRTAQLTPNETDVKAAAREQERAKIVAWLREVADGSSSAHFRSILIFAADAIERGEHDKPGDGA